MVLNLDSNYCGKKLCPSLRISYDILNQIVLSQVIAMIFVAFLELERISKWIVNVINNVKVSEKLLYKRPYIAILPTICLSHNHIKNTIKTQPDSLTLKMFGC